MGTASKSLKTLKDINEYIANLYSDTQSPIGSRISENKRYLTLGDGRILDTNTGKIIDNVEGLELFAGGLVR